MDGDDDMIDLQPEGRRNGWIENLGDGLDFEIVVARPEGSHLVPLPFARMVRYAVRHGAGHPAAFLDALEIMRLTPAALNGPLRTCREHRFHLHGIERDRPRAAEAGRNLLRQRVRQPLCTGRSFATGIRVSIVRTPQEMSKPTPPADTTPPSSGSKAATPPIGKP